MTTATNSLSHTTTTAYDAAGQALGGIINNQISSTVYYAPINANGTLGAWSQAGPLPTALDYEGAVVADGYLFSIGGFNGSSLIASIYSALISGSGTLGPWSQTTPLPTSTDEEPAVLSNGHIFAIAGNAPTGATSTLYYASCP